MHDGPRGEDAAEDRKTAAADGQPDGLVSSLEHQREEAAGHTRCGERHIEPAGFTARHDGSHRRESSAEQCCEAEEDFFVE